MMALKKTSKELTEGLEGVRQNIANVTFDLDDLRQAIKDLEEECNARFRKGIWCHK